MTCFLCSETQYYLCLLMYSVLCVCVIDECMYSVCVCGICVTAAVSVMSLSAWSLTYRGNIHSSANHTMPSSTNETNSPLRSVINPSTLYHLTIALLLSALPHSALTL